MKLPRHLLDRLQRIKDIHKIKQLARNEELEKLTNEVKDEKEEEEENDGEGKEKKISRIRNIFMLISIIVLQFCVLSGDTVIFPLFGQEGKKMGLNDIEIGVIFASYEISRFLSMPVFGSLLLRWPPRSMCFVGSVISGSMFIVFGLLSMVPKQYFFGLCIVIRLAAGAGSAMLTITSQTILLKATSFTTNTISAGLEMAIGAGFAFGPALGAALFLLGGYGLVFWVFGGVTLTLSILVYALVPEIEGKESGKLNPLDVLKIPGMFLMFMHNVSTRIDGRTWTTGISLWITSQFHKPESTVALLFGIWGVVYLIVCSIQSKIADKGYIYSSMILGWVLLIVPALLAGPSPLLNWIFHGKRYFWLTVIAMSLRMTIFPLVSVPSFQAALNLVVAAGHPADSVRTYGMVSGIMNCGTALGCILAPIISGAITQATDYSWATTALTVVHITMLVSFITFLVVMRATSKPLTPAEVTSRKMNASQDSDEDESELSEN